MIQEVSCLGSRARAMSSHEIYMYVTNVKDNVYVTLTEKTPVKHFFVLNLKKNISLYYIKGQNLIVCIPQLTMRKYVNSRTLFVTIYWTQFT